MHNIIWTDLQCITQWILTYVYTHVTSTQRKTQNFFSIPESFLVPFSNHKASTSSTRVVTTNLLHITLTHFVHSEISMFLLLNITSVRFIWVEADISSSFFFYCCGALLGFPDTSVSKESVCNAGDPYLIAGSEDPLEKGKATHSSILTGRIPWTV